MTDTFLLFVYGTLKRGGCRHAPLACEVYHGEARTLALYALHHLGDYPGLKHAPDLGQVVHGELYEVRATLRALLDEMEGAPDWFDLAPIELDGFVGPASAYYYQGDVRDHPRIESGVWHN